MTQPARPTCKQDAILRFRTQTMLLCALQQRSRPPVYHEPRSKSERSKWKDCDAIANALVLTDRAAVAVTAQLNADSCMVQAISAPVEQTSSSGVSVEPEPLTEASPRLPLPSQGSDSKEDELLSFASATAVQNPRPVSRRKSVAAFKWNVATHVHGLAFQKLSSSVPASASVLSRDSIFPFTSVTLLPRQEAFLEIQSVHRFRGPHNSSLDEHVIDLLSAIRDINEAKNDGDKRLLRSTLIAHFLVATAQKQLMRFRHRTYTILIENLRLIADNEHQLSPSYADYEGFRLNSFDISGKVTHPAIMPAIKLFRTIDSCDIDDSAFAKLVYLLFSAFYACLKAVCDEKREEVEAPLAVVLERVGVAAERCTRTLEFKAFVESHAHFLLPSSTFNSSRDESEFTVQVETEDAELDSLSAISSPKAITNAMQRLVSQVSSLRRLQRLKLNESLRRSLRVELIELPDSLGVPAPAEKWEVTLQAALIDQDQSEEVITLLKEHKKDWVKGWEAENPFKGVVHCESVLASLIFLAKTQSEDNTNVWQGVDNPIQESFRAASQTLGTSKLSCPACSTLLDILRQRLGNPFQYRGEHDHHYMCALPSELPDYVLYEMVERYNQKVKSAAEAFARDIRQNKMLSPDSAAPSSDSSSSSNDEIEQDMRVMDEHYHLHANKN